ncbi:MAG: hypothetical protein N2043_01975 [Ignavibacterium sp.]|nr:hypothetical protein [Ignavibacterium sp.]
MGRIRIVNEKGEEQLLIEENGELTFKSKEEQEKYEKSKGDEQNESIER